MLCLFCPYYIDINMLTLIFKHDSFLRKTYLYKKSQNITDPWCQLFADSIEHFFSFGIKLEYEIIKTEKITIEISLASLTDNKQ